MGTARRKAFGRPLAAAAAALIGIAVVAAVPAVASAHVASPGHVSAATYVPPKRTLKLGMKGADVKALQQRLAQLKYYPGAADGAFGNGTLEAVWAFQEVQHLAVDGVVGPKTGRALVRPRTYTARDPRQNPWRVEVNLTMRVLVNGEGVDLSARSTLADAVTAMRVELGGRRVAAAVDGEVVPRAEWARTELTDGARVELVVAVQGG